MRKSNKKEIKPSDFVTVPHLQLDRFEISAGDIIKVYGERGSKFKFIGVTTNSRTGSQWVDCFEIINGISSVFRSFKQDRIKRVPVRGKRAKRVI